MNVAFDTIDPPWWPPSEVSRGRASGWFGSFLSSKNPDGDAGGVLFKSSASEIWGTAGLGSWTASEWGWG